MARSAILGNGGLTVGIDENGLVHDFYYPYVGLENLNSARISPHYIGVWVDGIFSWLHDDTWENKVKLHENALITQSRHNNVKLGISIHIESIVDHFSDSFIRHVIIHNKTDVKKEVRIFFHQAFQISSEGRSDTALYVPEENYLLDYKGRCVLLVKASFEEGKEFDQYAVGNFGIEGKEGTYKDAEDGELSMNAVEHAGVDSILRLKCKIDAGATKALNYWVSVADTQQKAVTVCEKLANDGVTNILQNNLKYWQNWLKPAQKDLTSLSSTYRKAITTSLLTIKAHIDKRGGIIASCDSSIYNYGRDYYSYVWPRDGAFTIWPLIRLGIYEEARKFFKFCRDILSDEGYMQHKYQPDRAIGSTWHPLIHNKHKELAIQEDETALIVFMLGEYLDYSKDLKFLKSMYLDMVQPMANFMTRFVDDETGLPHASYDLWEEKFMSSFYTTAVTYRALMVASKLALDCGFQEDSEKWQKAANSIKENVDKFYDEKAQRFRKGLLNEGDDKITNDDTLDVSSLYGAFMFNFASSKEQIFSTAHAIENTLLDKSPSGGTPRYENDSYFRTTAESLGNPWFVTTLWMSQYYYRIGNTDKAEQYVEWALKNALPSGILSEQIDPENSKFLGVAPLVWSHAELINTILDVSDK